MTTKPFIGDERNHPDTQERERFGIFGEWEPWREPIEVVLIKHWCGSAESHFDTFCGTLWDSEYGFPRFEVETLYQKYGNPIPAQCPSCLAIDAKAANCPGAVFCNDKTCTH